MWQKYFNFIKLKPGKVVTAMFGLMDFSNPDLPVDKIKALYENDFPYLQITPLGEKELYGINDETESNDFTSDFINSSTEHAEVPNTESDGQQPTANGQQPPENFRDQQPKKNKTTRKPVP